MESLVEEEDEWSDFKTIEKTSNGVFYSYAYSGETYYDFAVFFDQGEASVELTGSSNLTSESDATTLWEIAKSAKLK